MEKNRPVNLFIVILFHTLSSVCMCEAACVCVCVFTCTHTHTRLCLPWYSNFFNQIDGERQRNKGKKDRGREEMWSQFMLHDMAVQRSAAHTHTHTQAHTQTYALLRAHRLLTVVTTCQGERQAANLKSLDVCRTGNNLLRSHTQKHTHKNTSHTHPELRAVCG